MRPLSGTSLREDCAAAVGLEAEDRAAQAVAEDDDQEAAVLGLLEQWMKHELGGPCAAKRPRTGRTSRTSTSKQRRKVA